MLRTRDIPCLQLLDETLVKTVRFKKPGYIGDFINTVRIFNELEVDELCFLSIRASQKDEQPNFEILSQIASECFMPLSYGGGIKDFETASRIFKMGFEKIVLNSVVFEKPELVTQLAEHFWLTKCDRFNRLQKRLLWQNKYVFARRHKKAKRRST